MASKLAVLETRLKELQAEIITNSVELDNWDMKHADFKNFGEYGYKDEWQNLNIGDIWARSGETAFLKKNIEIPENWKDEYVAFEMLTGGEGLLFIDGKAFHGVDDNRGYIKLVEKATGDEKFNCEIEIKTGGYWEYEPGDIRQPYILRACRIMTINKDIENAYYDFFVPCEIAAAMRDELLKNAIFAEIEECFLMVDFMKKKSDRKNFIKELKVAAKTLQERLANIKWHNEMGNVLYTGNSHIDVAWLWPLKETMRKVGRTYSTVAALMNEYPEYHFNCSQVPLFKYLKTNFPEIFGKIKERAKEGRFECIGGTWVENDTNLVSGESLVRQCLYGQRFFKNEMGADVKVGWLPDVFGYTYSLPQVYKKSGIDYFMTTKLSWNDTNKFPYQVFNWEGIDGSKILTYLSSSYVDDINLRHHYNIVMDTYKDRLVCSDYLAPYGWGDGGGGPTRANLDKIRRLDNMPGFPKAVQGKVHDFFVNTVEKSKNIPTYNGELYFEYHRGTYTAQANNKKFNRKSELALRDAEFLSVIVEDFASKYPKATFSENWETVLLNQFHDIIPGSSVNEVYKDSVAQYTEVLDNCYKIIYSALDTIANNADTSGTGTPVLIFNTLSSERSDVVELEWTGSKNIALYDENDTKIPFQFEDNKLVFVTDYLPPMGYAVYYAREEKVEEEVNIVFENNEISTPFFEITLNSDGTIARIWDIECEREVLPENSRANVLQMFEDKPTNYDAWELEPEYKQKSWEFNCVESPKLIHIGPTRIVIRTKYAYNESTVEQDMILYANKGTIDFKTKVDWKERHTLLKTAFPVNIRSSKATYEIAYGNIERSTTENTSIEKAQFEVSGHRWADLSETGFGVSILNDCKFGWDIKGNLMRLTLLRSPEYPDKEADLGIHEFTYSLFPHEGNMLIDTISLAHNLNSPLYAVIPDNHKGELEKVYSFAAVETGNVIIDCVKEAEDSKETIVRVYEPYGARGNVAISFDKIIKKACETDLLENKIADVEFQDDILVFDVKPYEIRTFKIMFDEL